MVDADQVERDAMAGSDGLVGLVEALDGADAGGQGAGADHHAITGGQRSAGERPRHHRATALGGEDAVRPTAGVARGRPRRGCSARGRRAQPGGRRALRRWRRSRARSARRPGTSPPRARSRPAYASSRRSSSTASTFDSATSPCWIPSSSRMRRCSSLWGFHPSVAATTKRQASTAPTPASMLRRKRTWPGTSTKLTVSPDGSVVWANPRSMVRPRRFSSSKRSGSVPVEREDERRLAVVDVPSGGDDPHGDAGGGAPGTRPASAVARW